MTKEELLDLIKYDEDVKDRLRQGTYTDMQFVIHNCTPYCKSSTETLNAFYNIEQGLTAYMDRKLRSHDLVMDANMEAVHRQRIKSEFLALLKDEQFLKEIETTEHIRIVKLNVEKISTEGPRKLNLTDPSPT